MIILDFCGFLDKYRKILEKVKKALEDNDLDDNQTLDTFLTNLEIEEEATSVGISSNISFTFIIKI